MQRLLIFLVVLTSVGCASTGAPFSGAVLERKYAIVEFEKAVVAEKKAFIADLQRYLDGDREAWFNVHLRQFPTVTEWELLRRELKDGDEIWVYRHQDNGRYLDGPPEVLRHVFCLVRGGNVVKIIDVPFASM